MTRVEPEYFPPESGPYASLTWPVALLQYVPEQIQNRTGIRFNPGYDDLDTLDWAPVVGMSGQRYALVYHRNAPKSGTEIVTRSDSQDPWADIVDVLNGLKLTKNDLVWTALEASKSQRSVAVSRSASKRVPTLTYQRRWRVKLSPGVANKLRRPVEGRGRAVMLLRKFQRQADRGELQVTPSDFEQLLSHYAEMRTSRGKGPQVVRRALKRASKKR